MANIKWEEPPFTVIVGDQDLSFFYYGNYGGPDYPDKKDLITAKKNEPLSWTELSATDAPEPADLIDYYFYVHDVESSNGNGYNKQQAEADFNLLTNLAGHTSTDPEESLYDGVATLAMAFELVTHDQVDAQNILFIIEAVHGAIDEIQDGISGLASDPATLTELAAILSVVFGPATDPTGTVFELEFTFPDVGRTEEQQEFLEFAVINALGEAINEPGEVAYVPPLLGGTDDYLLRFDVAQLDLDIVPVLLV
jgi:hypothetical protein